MTTLAAAAATTPTWLPGVLALVGVLLGGVMSFFFTTIGERRRERRESLQTLRLARSELGREVFTVVDDAVEHNTWPPGWQGATWDESWASYRQILAATLDYEDFETIATPYQRMTALQSGLQAGERELDAEREDGRDLKFLTELRDEIKAARDLLQSLVQRAETRALRRSGSLPLAEHARSEATSTQPPER